MSPYAAQPWRYNDLTTPLNPPRMTTIENGIASAYTIYANVKDAAYGAVGDGVTDDTTAIQSAINAIPTSSPVGGVVYFPPGFYRLTSKLTSRVQNLALVGAQGGQGQWPKVATGNTVIFSPPGLGAFDFNVAGPGTVFAGPTFSNLCFSPPYTTLSSSQTLGATLNVSASTIARLPTSGTAIVQDRHATGRFTYTGKTTNSLTGISGAVENVPGFTYQSASVVTVPAPYGLRISRTNDFTVERCTFMHYADSTASTLLDDGVHTLSGATGFIVDGSNSVCQYSVSRENRFYGCYRGCQEYSSSTRWYGGDFDSNMNGGTAWTGAIGWNGQLSNPCSFYGTTFHGADILAQMDGGVMFGCRYEDWITAAVNVVAGSHVMVLPASMNNFQGGAVGTGIAFDAATTNSFAVASQGVSLANRYTDAGTQNTIIDLDRIQTKGTVEVVGAGAPSVVANVGSTYRRTDGGAGTTFYVKESGSGLSTGWVAK